MLEKSSISHKKNQVDRERILQKADQLFTEHGYRGVSIRMIAEASEVTNAALYYHFKNKAALFAEVMRRHADKIGAQIKEAAVREDTYREKIAAMAATYFRLVSDRRSFMHLLRQDRGDIAVEADKTQFVDMLTTVFRPFDQVLGQAEAEGVVIDLPEKYSGAALLVGMLHSLGGYRMFCHGEQLTKEDVYFLVDILWQGISSANQENQGE